MPDRMNRRTFLGAAVGAAGLRLPSDAPAAFVIRDWLGRDWRNERVRFQLGSSNAGHIGRGHAVRDARGGLVPFELVGDSIELLVDVPAFAEQRFELRADGGRAQTDLRVRETPDLLMLSNAAGAVALRRRLTADQAPIAGIDRGDGVWVGASRLPASKDAVASYQATLERRGPVAATVVCRTSFASGTSWEMRVTLQASDPAVLVEEVWSQWDHPQMVLDFTAQFAPTHLYYRNGADAGKATVGTVAFEPLSEDPGGKVFELEPWLHWWLSPRRGNWVAAYSDQRPKALVVGALRGDQWLTEQDLALHRQPQVVDVVRTPGGLDVVFPGRASRRNWLLAMLPKEAIDQTLVGKRVRPPPQDLVIRHGDLPLDRVKDWTLNWPRADGPPSRLMLEPDDIARLKAAPPDAASLAAARSAPLGETATEATLGKVVPAYLATGDEALGRKLSTAALAQMQAATDLFVGQNDLVTMGFAPHWHTRIVYAAHVADFGLADAFLSAAERDQLRAQAAFLAYTVSRPDYWSPAHGFFANPGMTSTVAAYQAYLACLIPDHPLAKTWLDGALGELMNELLTWSDEDGGWLEAPHYAMNACDYLLGVAVCARNKDRPEMIEHPRLRRVLEWFGKISTPPDARLDNERHFPPIGNTFLLERTGEFGLAAYLWRKSDPQLSARLQWLHQASGSPSMPFIGGAYPAFAPYRAVFSDAALPASQPDYASELFPKTGVILRAGFGTPRETQLLLIAGANHSHYDYDSGSVTIWGKGASRTTSATPAAGRCPTTRWSTAQATRKYSIYRSSSARRAWTMSKGAAAAGSVRCCSSRTRTRLDRATTSFETSSILGALASGGSGSPARCGCAAPTPSCSATMTSTPTLRCSDRMRFRRGPRRSPASARAARRRLRR